MKTSKEPQRAWLYARVPGNYIETKNTLNVLMLQAQRDGAEVVGWGYDIHHGWLRRPAYRRMMREAKAGTYRENLYLPYEPDQWSGTASDFLFQAADAVQGQCHCNRVRPESESARLPHGHDN